MARLRRRLSGSSEKSNDKRLRPMISLLQYIPKNQFSYLVGKLSRLNLPQPISRPVLRWFIKRYGVNVSEAMRPVDEYRNLAEFFIRDLKPGLRPVGKGVVSPVDGRITEFGLIERGTLLQVKGKSYTVAELLCDEKLSQCYQNGFFITIYLAPPDYHHVHSPVAGIICEMHYIPGTLWPVNEQSVQKIEKLFTVNERVATVIETGRGRVTVVKVGAMNVGSISLGYDTLISNRELWGKREIVHRCYATGITVKKGDRIGTFNLGSTVILLFEAGKFVPGAAVTTGPVKLGVSISGEDS